MTQPSIEPSAPPVRRARHLIDPANPPARQRPEERRRDEASLARVKQWVMSALVVTTMFHLAVGLTIAAIFTDTSRVDARIGLNVIAGILLVAGIVGARAIHNKPPVSPWLALGLLPTAVGLYLTFH